MLVIISPLIKPVKLDTKSFFIVFIRLLQFVFSLTTIFKCSLKHSVLGVKDFSIMYGISIEQSPDKVSTNLSLTKTDIVTSQFIKIWL
mgnify:CR=1 FL=1